MADGLDPTKKEEIKLDDWALWFTLDNSASDTGEACKVVSYELVTTGDGSDAVVSDDPIIKLADGTITIIIAEVPLEGKSYFLKASTNGGVAAYKEITLKRVEDPCVYKVKPVQFTMTEPYVEGTKIELGNIIKSYFDFERGAGCPTSVDEIQTFGTDADYPANPSTKTSFDAAPVLTMSEDTKGKNKYKFAVSAVTKSQVSNEAHVDIIICGKETMSLTEGNTEPLVIEFLRG
jgi:hypothetical protein